MTIYASIYKGEEMQIIWQNAWKQAAEILAAAGNKQRF